MTNKVLVVPKNTQAYMRRLQAEFGGDMTAMFKLVEREIVVIVRKAGREGWDVQKLFDEIDKVFV